MSIISADAFKKKACRIIQIPGFAEGEVFEIGVKPVSLMAMMQKGTISNELLGEVVKLFEDDTKEINPTDIFSDMEMVNSVMEMMNRVCKEVMIEPKYEEIKDYMSDEQKQSIFEQVSGTKAIIPSDTK